jgi:coenzyme F420-reducing hydrogenase gamma subunit
MPNKLNIGWFSFACCEDSTIMFTELLNDYFFEFKAHFNFVDAGILSSKRDHESPLDIAFIEGAANDPKHPDKLTKIRQRSKKVVAIGSCACTSMPSAHRNNFTPEQKADIQFLLDKFEYPEKIQKIADIIPVDASVPGCPMDLVAFVKAVNGLLVEFGHQPLELKGFITRSSTTAPSPL